MKRSLPLILFLLAIGCTSARPAVEPTRVVIVGTTDVHGWFNGRVETPPGGGEGVAWGGLPTLAAYVNALRAAHGGRVLVVDSGDIFQGTLESNMFEGEPVFRGYNALGYTAAAVGNHEFDFGPLGPEAIPREPGDDPLGALKRNAAIADFPMLSANLVEKATGRTPAWAKRSALVRVGDARVGLIGLSTPDTPNVTMAINVRSLDFTDPVAATIAAAKELRAQGADAIVVVAHIGGRCTNVDDPHDAESCDRQTEAIRLLEQIPAGTVDAFFGGHTHAQMRHYINGVAALQAEAHSREFSAIDLWIDPQQNRVVKSEMRPHTMICAFVYEGTSHCDPRQAPAGAALVRRVYEGRTIVPDQRVATTIEPYLRQVAAKRDEKIGAVAAARFTRSYSAESPLGNLIADALRQSTGADVAFMNSGGIRSDLPAGELTYGDIFSVSPFDNYPARVTMTGAQIADLLRVTTSGRRGVLQVSGLRYTIDYAKDEARPEAERNRITSITREDGTPLDPDKLYTVVMPDFVAYGGDGAEPVMATVPPDRVQISYDAALRDVLVGYLSARREPLVPSTNGRITVLNRPAE